MLECAVAFGHSNGSWDNGRKSQKQPLISTRSTAAVSALQSFATVKSSVGSADMDETALAVLALVAGVLHRLKRGDFVN